MDEEEREEAVERQEKLKDYDWSFGRNEDIAYGLMGGPEEDWLVLPRSDMEALADASRSFDENGVPDVQPDSDMASWLPSDVLDAYGMRRFDLGGSELLPGNVLPLHSGRSMYGQMR